MGFSLFDSPLSLPIPDLKGQAKLLNNIANIDQYIRETDSLSYSVTTTNWFSAKPYGFRMNMRDGTQVVMFLPIAPNNINIVTNFATNVVPTLYGTVEEHSEVRYFDIVIEGTTGLAPAYTSPAIVSGGASISATAQKYKNPGRASFPIAQGVSAGGFFSQTISSLTNTLDKAANLIGGAPPVDTGVYTDQTGYVAFHNLYKFLLRHKADVSGSDGKAGPRTDVHPLQFFNYKDGNQYDVVVRNFVLRRTAEDPMMYYYQITLRGYNIRNTGDAGDKEEDLNARLADLGLNGINSSSLLGNIKSISSQVKGVLGSAVGGINVLGR